MNAPKITSLEIHYETMPSININGLSSSLNVIYGKNESGKSRIKEFLEWMMFASSKQFEALTPQYRNSAFKTIEQNTHGSISLFTDQGEYVFSQIKNKKVVSPSISPSGLSIEDAIHLLTDDISLDHYRNVFALNLNALTREQSNTLLTEDQIAEVFLSAAQTGSGVSLSALVGELGVQKEAIFSVSGNASKRDINKIIKDLSETEKEIRQIRRDQKAIFSNSAEVEDLIKQVNALESKIKTTTERIEKLNLSVNYFEPFREYENLSSLQPEAFDTDLINEIPNITTLIKECEHHLGDERELTQLLSSKVEIDTDCEQLHARLIDSLEPDNAPDEIQSHEFRTSLENEKNSRYQYVTDQARAQEIFDRESGELALLTKRSAELIEEVEAINFQNAQLNNQIESDQHKENTFQKKSKKMPLISAFTFVTGIAVLIASFITNQVIGIVSGVVLAVLGLILFFTQDHSKQKQLQPDFARTDSLENNQIAAIQRELSNNQSRVEHHQKQVEESITKLKELENSRSLRRKEFENKITNLGFNNAFEPSHIEMYLTDLDKYQDLRRKQEEVTIRTEALSTWFENFYDKIAALQESAKNSPLKNNEQITSLIQAQTWLNLLLELSTQYQKIEKDLLETESRTRQLEKILETQFLSIANARENFASASIEDIRHEIATLNEEKTKFGDERQKLDREIGSLKSTAAHVSQETKLQDLLQTRESQLLELSHLHEKFTIASVAHSIAEKAFSDCQRDSQPEVLLKASQLFSLATNNKWSGISIGINEQARTKSGNVRITVSSDSNSLDASKLSQGTQEQLYLSLRMALMQTSLRGKYIPTLFDDIAVNSDHQRLKSITPLIGEVANTRQVFYFTCHEWVRDELASLPNAHVISL